MSKLMDMKVQLGEVALGRYLGAGGEERSRFRGPGAALWSFIFVAW